MATHKAILRVDQVPTHFQEMFILTGYRNPKSSLLQCLKSIFQLNNETFNIWTHLIPGFYFIWLTCHMFLYDLDVRGDPFSLPLLAYMITLCIMPIASAVAHIFNTMSDRARHVCFFLDYAALSLYSLGAAIAYATYSLPEVYLGTTFAKVFVPIAVVNAVGSMSLSCVTRFMKSSPRRKLLRITAYAVPYMFDVIPIVHRALLDADHEAPSGGLALHLRQFVFAVVSAFLYCSHMPERFSPGTFDVWGHSHQIFHVTTVMGSFDQLGGFLQDRSERRGFLSSHTDMPSFQMSVLVMLVVAAVNVLQMIIFSQFLHTILPSSPAKRSASTLNGGSGERATHVKHSPSRAPSHTEEQVNGKMSNGIASKGEFFPVVNAQTPRRRNQPLQ